MSEIALRSLMIALTALVTLQGQSLLAAPVVVGTCLPGVHFTTIQAAVEASVPGGTVSVCPGTYLEQIIINAPLLLKGVKNGRSQAVIIGVGPGLTGTFPAQILIQSATGVSISDLIVDGTGAVCTGSIYGIVLDGAGATISNSVVRNVKGTQACPGRAVGAFNSSSITFKNNLIHDSVEGVSTSHSTGSITGNTILTQRTGINAGITAGPLAITNNVMNVGLNCAPPDCQGTGINIYQASSTVSSNTIVLAVSAMGHGIDIVESHNATVKSNKVDGAWQAISLTNSISSTVTGNTLNNTGYVALTPNDGSPGANVIINNVVNEAPCGMNMAAAKGDTLTPNTYHNTTLTTCN